MAVINVGPNEPMLCRVCLTAQPAECFYRVDANNDSLRQDECKICCAERKRNKLRAKRAKRDRRTMLIALGQLSRAKSNAQIRLAIQLMFFSFGNDVSKVAEAWQSYFEEASGRTDYFKLRALLAFSKLCMAEDEIRRQEAKAMTFEEAKDSLFQLADEFIEENPARIASIMQARGWKVEPPPGLQIQPAPEIFDVEFAMQSN